MVPSPLVPHIRHGTSSMTLGSGTRSTTALPFLLQCESGLKRPPLHGRSLHAQTVTTGARCAMGRRKMRMGIGGCLCPGETTVGGLPAREGEQVCHIPFCSVCTACCGPMMVTDSACPAQRVPALPGGETTTTVAGSSILKRCGKKALHHSAEQEVQMAHRRMSGMAFRNGVWRMRMMRWEPSTLPGPSCPSR